MKILKKLSKISGISLIFLLAFLITSIPAVAQTLPTCDIAINYLGLNPYADFDPVVQDELKCSFWTTANPNNTEGHYYFVIEHPAGWFLTSYNIDMYFFPADELDFGHVDPIIDERTATKTYFHVGRSTVTNSLVHLSLLKIK
jgi:hypothetical protein